MPTANPCSGKNTPQRRGPIVSHCQQVILSAVVFCFSRQKAANRPPDGLATRLQHAMIAQLCERPLGTAVPDSVHAVCCSLPTLADVIGYEEREERVMSCLQSGYPRFVFHPYVLRVLEHVAAATPQFGGRKLYAVPSASAAEQFLAWLGNAEACLVKAVGDFFVVGLAEGTAALPLSAPQCARAKSFLQHTGLGLSSRQAEAYLVAHGLLKEPQAEARYLGASSDFYVKAHLKDFIASTDIHLCTSGMNAFYAALKATRKVQAAANKRLYIQLGWLYLDTQCILEKFLDKGDTLHVQFDVFDKAALEKLFAERGSEIAAVITELPNNPLIRTLDIQWLSQLCLRYGVARIFDPTVVGIANVDVLPYCDLLVTSLTKYAANRGDIMCGALALNPQSPLATALRPLLPAETEPLYEGDCARLATQIGDMAAVSARQNENALALIAWLEQQPQVAKVHHPLCGPSAENFRHIARSQTAVGAMLTIELRGDLAAFYDNTPVVKGPSFGTDFTMMCPFMYMAHYEQVTEQAARERLYSLDLNPELVRISVGTEPFEAIREAFAKGLACL